MSDSLIVSFGFLQEALNIGIMPVYLLILAALTIGLLEITNRVSRKKN